MSEGILTVRRMEKGDVPRVREIERRCFSDLWPADGFDRELENEKVAFYIVADLDGMVIGYMGAWLILEEAHVTTFGVDPEYRNRKVASTLMLCFMREAVSKGSHWSTLEVSEKNEHAIRLYSRFGYKTVSKRRKYYGENEDGLLMWVGGMQNSDFSKRLDEIETEISPEGCQK